MTSLPKATGGTDDGRPEPPVRVSVSRRAVLGGMVALVVGVLLVARLRLERARGRLVDDLLAAADTGPAGSVTSADLAGLPAPARRYFETVLGGNQQHVRTVRLEQRGEFRLGGADAPWKPLDATQHFTVDPPGFVWDAAIEVAPFVPVRVVDTYADGEGWLRAKLLSLVTVAESDPAPEMDAGELVRYLAECVWFPTALLPAAGVEWTPIDGRSARATLAHGGTSVSLDVHFDDRNLVERVVAERYRAVDGGFEPARWTGHFHDYQERAGMTVPIEAEVEWNLPDGDLPYWRAEITDIEYQ